MEKQKTSCTIKRRSFVGGGIINGNSSWSYFRGKIGWFFEEMIIDHYKKLLINQNVYVDYKHKRAARNKKQKVRWKDIDGNHHDLDVVIERNGSEENFGTPIAFIEVAWRRYTKHSKNKAQEISGAVLPIISRYNDTAPFYGAALSGDFTPNSISQLKTEGFYVIYFPSELIFDAFSSEGINIRFDVGTTDDILESYCDLIDNLSHENIENIRKYLVEHNKDEIDEFDKAMINSINRRITSIAITALYGEEKNFDNIASACYYLSTIASTVSTDMNMAKIEIKVTFSNGDYVNMVFHDKQPALVKLREFQNFYKQ